MDGAVFEAALLLVAGVGEHLDHLAVGRQHLGREAADPALAGHRTDVFEQGGGDPASLVGVLDQEGDLGLVGGSGGRAAVGADPVVADGGDELAADRRGEADPVHVVVVREAVHVPVGEAGVGSEEPVVLRLVRDLLVEADQPARVVGGDGPDPGRSAVTEDHVGFPVVRVRGVGLGRHGVTLRLERFKWPGRGASGKLARIRASWGRSNGGKLGPKVGSTIPDAVRDWSRQP